MMSMPGRPQDPTIGAALLDAARDLLVERGYAGLSVDAVVRRVGTTRPAFYRRYTGLDALVLELVRDRVPGLDGPSTGALDNDLVAVQRAYVAFLLDPVVRLGLSGLLARTGTDDGLRAGVIAAVFEPWRGAVVGAFAAAATRGEVTGQVDAVWAGEMLVGPLVLRMQMPEAGPLDDALARRTVVSALRATAAPWPS